MVNVVGDHADYHLKYDAPLQSDLDGVARSVSQWVARADEPGAVPHLGAEAIRHAKNGEITTLILPANSAWGESRSAPVPASPPPAKPVPAADRIAAAATTLQSPDTALLVGGWGLYGEGAELSAQIAVRSGARLLAPFFAPRIEKGEGAVAFDQMFYPAELNAAFLAGLKRIICVGEAPPVNFFAYPGKPSLPTPPDCSVDVLCHPDWDVQATLKDLAAALGVDGSEDVPRIAKSTVPLEEGPLTAEGIGRALAQATPEGAIMVNEAVTAGASIWPFVDTSARHDRLGNTGGSIGQCLPAALGAAVACPGRPVFAVSGDGSAMYQVQCLWTAARERLDITTIIIANRGYQILHLELAAQGAPAPGRNARAMFDIEDPLLDWVALAKGHGVPAQRVDCEAGLAEALAEAAQTDGPFLIEAVI